MNDCARLINIADSCDGDEKRKLTAELCLVPEVYFVLSDLLAGKIVLKENDFMVDSVENCDVDGAFVKDATGDKEIHHESNVLELSQDVLNYFETSSKVRHELQACNRRKS